MKFDRGEKLNLFILALNVMLVPLTLYLWRVSGNGWWLFCAACWTISAACRVYIAFNMRKLKRLGELMKLMAES